LREIGVTSIGGRNLATRIADRSRRRAAERLVGRDDQLAALTTLLDPDPPALIAFVHGIAGIGKTALLRPSRSRRRRAARVSSSSTAGRSSRPSAASSWRSATGPSSTPTSSSS
jgi:AAA ATPase domain